MNTMKHVTLVGPVSTDEQALEWMTSARTAETQAHVRSHHSTRDSEAFDDVHLAAWLDDDARNSKRSAGEELLS